MKKILVLTLMCIMVLGLTTIAQAGPYPETQKSLMAAVTGETQASANYLAYAEVAENEGHKGIALVFRVISEAEAKHADDEFAILQSINSSVERPKPDEVKPGTTKENLQAAIDGETYEFTVMYPEFIIVAQVENMLQARGIFTLAKLSEEVHAGIYADLLKNFDNFDSVKYAKIYRCPDCGNIVPTIRPLACSICGDAGDEFIEYVLN